MEAAVVFLGICCLFFLGGCAKAGPLGVLVGILGLGLMFGWPLFFSISDKVDEENNKGKK